MVAPARHELRVLAPYRLDLTVSALRRLPTNPVDVLTPAGDYVRALTGARGPVIVRVSQARPDMLVMESDGDAREHAAALVAVRRMLGVERDLAPFYASAARVPWLAPLALRMRGVKPPCYPTLWEACVNAIVFQQVSLLAATAIMRRLILAIAPPLEQDGTTIHEFPSADRFLELDDDVLRATGLSTAKLATLRRAAVAIGSGALTNGMLDDRPSRDAAALLQQIKGIGPWTATVILLRGLGRLDVFPMNDSSVVRNVALVAGVQALDIADVLNVLGAQRGMLYYHLLLARLEARGDVAHDTTQRG